MTSKKLNINESITPNSVEPISNSAKEAAKKKLKEFMQEETKLVRGIFKCFETPGSTVKITVKKYPGIQHFEKSMTDGMSYEVPLYVARHLNGIDVTAGALGDPDRRNQMIGTCSYPIHGFKWERGQEAPRSIEGMGGAGESGIPVPIVGVSKRYQRYGFQSLEFGSSAA
jgi:hypothetical protein